MEDVKIYNSCLGSGSFGAVFEGSYEGKAVAIKRLSLEKEKQYKDYYKSEVEVHRVLDHPNIVKLHTTFNTKKYLYMVMEKSIGGDLAGYLKNNEHLNEHRCARWFYQMLQATQYMHSKYIVHRDLKPANILISHDDTVKLTDFGLSVHYSSEWSIDTMHEKTFQRAGTPNHLPPEVLSVKDVKNIPTVEGGRRELWKRLKSRDIWALGVIFYIMISGKHPFDNQYNQSKETKRRISPSAKARNTTLFHQKVRHCDYHRPLHVSEEAMEVLRKMLCPWPTRSTSASDIMTCAFFKKRSLDTFLNPNRHDFSRYESPFPFTSFFSSKHEATPEEKLRKEWFYREHVYYQTHEGVTYEFEPEQLVFTITDTNKLVRYRYSYQTNKIQFVKRYDAKADPSGEIEDQQIHHPKYIWVYDHGVDVLPTEVKRYDYLANKLWAHLRARSPKIQLDDSHHKGMLMWDGPSPSFQLRLKRDSNEFTHMRTQSILHPENKKAPVSVLYSREPSRLSHSFKFRYYGDAKSQTIQITSGTPLLEACVWTRFSNEEKVMCQKLLHWYEVASEMNSKMDSIKVKPQYASKPSLAFNSHLPPLVSSPFSYPIRLSFGTDGPGHSTSPPSFEETSSKLFTSPVYPSTLRQVSPIAKPTLSSPQHLDVSSKNTIPRVRDLLPSHYHPSKHSLVYDKDKENVSPNIRYDARYKVPSVNVPKLTKSPLHQRIVSPRSRLRALQEQHTKGYMVFDRPKPNNDFPAKH